MKHITVQWENDDKTVIHMKLVGHWCRRDFYTAIDEAFDMMRAQPHTVHIVADMRDSEHFPRHVTEAARYYKAGSPGNRGLVVIVGAHPFIRNLIYYAGQIVPGTLRGIHFADTPAEAETLLAAHQFPAAASS